MRQAVEPPLPKAHDAGTNLVEKIVDVLLRHSTDEEQILERTADLLANTLDYVAVLITALEENQNLTLRAFACRVGHGLADQIQPQLQQARDDRRVLAQLDDVTRDESLALYAIRATLHETQSGPVPAAVVMPGDFSDLFYPLIDKETSTRWQAKVGVQQLLAQPYVLPDELCGCLLVASSRPTFSEQERRLLQVAAQHLALGIRNARLYWRLEEERRAAQAFAQIAFSGSAYLHTLRNQIGGLRTFLGLVQAIPQMKPRQRDEVVATSRKAMESLDQAAEILDHLHEPWRRHADVITDVNDCLTAALLKLFGDLTIRPGDQRFDTTEGVQIEWRLADDLPAVQTSPEMLTEVFRIVLRNAVDALREKFGPDDLAQGRLAIESAKRTPESDHIVVAIADNGPGIAPDNLRHIFELGWSTKGGQGMGFGLFWARNFVEGLGGAIGVDSAEHEGTTFRLTIPSAANETSQRA